MFRTTEDITLKVKSDVIYVPEGTLVMPTKKNKTEIGYVVIDINVLDQQNPHDRKYNYVWIPSNIVKELK